MGIRVTCPNCNRQLNVKSFLAGKRGVCPDCNTKFEIPSGSEHNVVLEVEESENTLAARRSDLQQQEGSVSLPIDFAPPAAAPLAPAFDPTPAPVVEQYPPAFGQPAFTPGPA